jgi:hypothetical protein
MLPPLGSGIQLGRVIALGVAIGRWGDWDGGFYPFRAIAYADVVNSSQKSLFQNCGCEKNLSAERSRKRGGRRPFLA